MPANPVNVAVRDARVLRLAGQQIWLDVPDHGLTRAWAPKGAEDSMAPGHEVEVYLGHEGSLNGWWHRGSGLAVNQRGLDAPSGACDSQAMACQGQCGVVWLAPAGEVLADRDENCLTCNGQLAPSAGA